MPVLEKSEGLLEALKGAMTPKFLATRSSDGIPNVVPCVSLLPADDQQDILFFGNFLLRKSIRNLQEDSRVGVLVITPQLQGWVLRGDFLEFQRTGTYVDQQMNSGLLRYNAYTGIRNAGLIRVRSVERDFKISRLQVALDFIRARWFGWHSSPEKSLENKTVKVPLPVRREFARMAAVKVLAWIAQDGYPDLMPALSLQPRGERALVGWMGASRMPVPPGGVTVASNILTFEAISYQAKGRWESSGSTGRLAVTEVYAGGPPIPGGRVA